MISEADIRSIITTVVPDVDAEKIGKDETFADAGIDSLDHANILLEIQEQHGLAIPDEALDECSTISGIVAYSEKHGG